MEVTVCPYCNDAAAPMHDSGTALADRVAMDECLARLRELDRAELRTAATLLTMLAPGVQVKHGPVCGEAVLQAARVLYVLAREGMDEREDVPR